MKFSKFESVLLAEGFCESSEQNFKVILFTNYGIIECRLSNFCTVEDCKKNQDISNAQVVFATTDDENWNKQFEDYEKQDCILLKDVTILSGNGARINMNEMLLFLDHVLGVSFGNRSAEYSPVDQPK